MDINCINENQKLTVAVSGRLDSTTVHDLEGCLKEQLREVTELVFDFAGLEYLSSARLRVLLASYKKMSGNMEIKNANDMLVGIFEMTGMSTFFNINRG